MKIAKPFALILCFLAVSTLGGCKHSPQALTVEEVTACSRAPVNVSSAAKPIVKRKMRDLHDGEYAYVFTLHAIENRLYACCPSADAVTDSAEVIGYGNMSISSFSFQPTRLRKHGKGFELDCSSPVNIIDDRTSGGHSDLFPILGTFYSKPQK